MEQTCSLALFVGCSVLLNVVDKERVFRNVKAERLTRWGDVISANILDPVVPIASPLLRYLRPAHQRRIAAGCSVCDSLQLVVEPLPAPSFIWEYGYVASAVMLGAV